MDGRLTLSSFSLSCRIEVQELSRDRALFDLIGVDAAVANALRRLLLAELPCMAIEKVVVFQNTSIVPDEVLAHRLGLLPLKADPRRFAFTEGQQSELNTLVFTLDVACSRVSAASDTAAAEDRFAHSLVTSADVQWQPQGRQAEELRQAEPAVYYPDIVIAKLRPGQSIECEMHAEKGTGERSTRSVCASSRHKPLPRCAALRSLPLCCCVLQEPGGDGFVPHAARRPHCAACDRRQGEAAQSQMPDGRVRHRGHRRRGGGRRMWRCSALWWLGRATARCAASAYAGLAGASSCSCAGGATISCSASRRRAPIRRSWQSRRPYACSRPRHRR